VKILSRLLKFIGRPIIKYLNKPAVRHKYLPKIQELVQYNRKEAMLSACLEYVHWTEVKGDYLEFGHVDGW
jgi:hypothetical protein